MSLLWKQRAAVDLDLRNHLLEDRPDSVLRDAVQDHLANLVDLEDDHKTVDRSKALQMRLLVTDEALDVLSHVLDQLLAEHFLQTRFDELSFELVDDMVYLLLVHLFEDLWHDS